MTGLPRGRQRARSEPEKALRRSELLNAAERLLERGDYETATMSAIAAYAGISKPSAYLYFATKEALFLSLLTERLQTWFDDVGSALDEVHRPTKSYLVRAVAGSLAERPTLRQLLVLLHGTLEHNVSVEEARAFKRAMADGMSQLGLHIERALTLPDGYGMRLLMLTHALCLGITQMAAPSPAVCDVIKNDPTLAFFQVDFRQTFEDALADLLQSATHDNPAA